MIFALVMLVLLGKLARIALVVRLQIRHARLVQGVQRLQFRFVLLPELLQDAWILGIDARDVVIAALLDALENWLVFFMRFLEVAITPVNQLRTLRFAMLFGEFQRLIGDA